MVDAARPGPAAEALVAAAADRRAVGKHAPCPQYGVARAHEARAATGADLHAAAPVDVTPGRLGRRAPLLRADVAADAVALSEQAADVPGRGLELNERIRGAGACEREGTEHGGQSQGVSRSS